MAAALELDPRLDGGSYQLYVEQFIEEAGKPTDPVERMLLEQLALAHFRIGQLHVSAAKATGIEAVKILNSATARLLGEFRRTALAVRVYRTRVPEGKRVDRLKVYKQAQ
jgi:hypothetical protein